MIALLKWAWNECSTLDFILLVAGLIVFILIMVAILISLYLQNEDLIQMKVLLWAVALADALEAFDQILHDEIGQLPPGYTFYDEELWEISKTEHEKKREAKAERKRKRKLSKMRTEMRRMEQSDPAHGYRDLEDFIESCCGGDNSVGQDEFLTELFRIYGEADEFCSDNCRDRDRTRPNHAAARDKSEDRNASGKRSGRETMKKQGGRKSMKKKGTQKSPHMPCKTGRASL